MFTLILWFDYGILRRGLDLSPGQAVGAMAFVLLARAAASLFVDVVSRTFAG